MPKGRPPSTKTLVDRQLGRNVKHPILPAGDGFIIPNLSGDHSAGHTGTPVTNLDIANKKYVDDKIEGVTSIYARSATLVVAASDSNDTTIDDYFCA